VVQVSTKNGPAAEVSVTLAAKPTSQKPTFTSGCAKGDKTASCTVGSVSDKQTVSLDAQIPVERRHLGHVDAARGRRGRRGQRRDAGRG
jgi:hypothetical protein